MRIGYIGLGKMGMGMVKLLLEKGHEVVATDPNEAARNEAEAAGACGVARHVLRDLRLSGRIKARKLGRKVVYTREDLMRALEETPERADQSEGRTSRNHGARNE